MNTARLVRRLPGVSGYHEKANNPDTAIKQGLPKPTRQFPSQCRPNEQQINQKELYPVIRALGRTSSIRHGLESRHHRRRVQPFKPTVFTSRRSNTVRNRPSKGTPMQYAQLGNTGVFVFPTLPRRDDVRRGRNDLSGDRRDDAAAGGTRWFMRRSMGESISSIRRTCTLAASRRRCSERLLDRAATTL